MQNDINFKQFITRLKAHIELPPISIPKHPKSFVTKTKEEILETSVKLENGGCPFCGHVIERVNVAKGEMSPCKPGDISVCSGCAEVIIFDDELKFRKPDFEDWMKIGENPDFELELEKSQVMMKRYIAKHKAK